MKENEVMVGDWFRYRYTIENREIIRTFRISRIENELKKYYVWGDGFGRMCYPEKLEPIPITAEILEKNGFENDFYEDESVADYVKVRLEGYSLHTTAHEWDKALITWCNGHVEVVTDFSGEFRGEIENIHELQHALRLCGIDKEITI